MKTSYILKLVEYSLIIVILTATATIPVSVFAAEAAVVSVSPATQIVSAGTQFTLNITVQPNNAVAGVQFNLSFNPALITANSVTEGNLLKQNGASTFFTPGTINNAAGTITGVAGAITSPRQTVSTTGTFASITFTAGATKGSSSITLTNVIVGDINGQTLTISLINGQASVDRAPVLAAVGSKTVNENVVPNFTTSATDADRDSLTYSASTLPTGAVFNASTRNFSWTPTYTQAGSYPNVHFQVSDGSLTASENITITVNNVDRAPVLAAIGNKTVNESTVLSFNIMVSDPDGDALTYTATSLPSCAAFNPSTQLFTWTPTHTQIGSFPNVHFQVSDGTMSASEYNNNSGSCIYSVGHQYGWRSECPGLDSCDPALC